MKTAKWGSRILDVLKEYEANSKVVSFQKALRGHDCRHMR